MRTLALRRLAAAAGAAGLVALLPAGAALADPTPSPGAATVTKAGTSFLTATVINAGQPVRVPASTGDYLYWSFSAEAGDVHEITATVTFPANKTRTGQSTWSIDVFDGLRRRQACTAGAQTPTAAVGTGSVSLGCTLRRVRPWAEPWSGDPLPGTYYVRLSVTDLPEPDLGLPVDVDLLVSADENDGVTAEDGNLRAPLVPQTKAGKVLANETAAEQPPVDEEADGNMWTDWIPDLSSRWVWTTIGGVLAAVAGVVGFAMTRRAHR